jgi:hypothetical protein
MLTTAPGISIRAMQQGSNVEVRWPASTASHGYVQPQGAHVVTLSIADALLALPEGRFSIVETRHGIAARIHCTPQLDHLPLQEAFALCRQIEERLVERRFDVAESLEFSQTQACLAGPRGEARVSALTAPHGSGSWRAEIRLRRLVEAGSALAKRLAMAEDGFVATLVLWDPPLLDVQP